MMMFELHAQVKTEGAEAVGFSHLSGLIASSRNMRISHKKQLDHRASHNADGVCDKVLPRKDVPEYQMTECGVPHIRQPRRIAQLQNLNPERESKCRNAH
jgi:hypothetical protein